ncbi:hypothetical protein HanPSC8_Chr02g0079911 [Helianthus annuus]|nr:hypothetical protein HanPSC8_Chr02g0079911 [Helianthus annuus]
MCSFCPYEKHVTSHFLPRQVLEKKTQAEKWVEPHMHIIKNLRSWLPKRQELNEKARHFQFVRLSRREGQETSKFLVHGSSHGNWIWAR